MSTLVITGSTQGIGAGLALEFARQGHRVLASGRSQEGLDALIAKDSSGNLQGKTCDVSQWDDVQALWDHAVAEFGQVDIWINNAGFARTVWPVVETPPDEIERMVKTNMLGSLFGSRVAAAGMLAQGQGKLFNMLGGGSDGETFPGMGIYGSTKRGIDYCTNAMIKELKDSPVLVAKIRPGMIITEGVVREAKADPENFERSRKTMNNLVDTVETVAPFLVEKILSTDKHGSKIRWLTGGKIARRMLLARFKPRPDQFERYGL